jgi:hypothetical protein
MKSQSSLPFALVLLALTAAPAPAATVRFAIIADRTGSHVPGVYEAILGEADALAPDFIVTVGDQIEGYTEDVPTLESQWDEFDGIVKGLREPLFLTPGNHDILNPTMEAEWRKRTGHEPNYTFDREGIHCVILDTGRWETGEEWLAAEGHRAWLEADLAAHANDAMTIAFFHKPYWYATLAEGKSDPLHELFRKYGVDAVFNGHFHIHGTAVYDGIPYTIAGSSGGYVEEDEERGSFFGYLFCTARDGKLEWSVLKAGSVRRADMTLVSDLKFFDRVETEYVGMEPFPVREGEPSGPIPGTIRLRNATAAPLQVNAIWESGSNWSIEPQDPSVVLEPGAGASVAFHATPKGPFYPLPRLRFDYPYREGRVFHYEGTLPACRVQRAPRFGRAPSIDGKLEETTWAGAGKAEVFCAPDGGPVVIEPTTFLFGYDDANLYLAARCAQADGATLTAKAAERDQAVTQDDCVGYFVSGDPAEKTFCQIYVNANGVLFDQKLTVVGPDRYEGDGPKWDGAHVVAVGRGDGYWEVEAAIPFETLGFAPPAPGGRWRVNFRRKEIARQSSADWQYPIGFEPQRFGYLVFE